MASQPPYYMQTDSRWKSAPYAVKGESSTIGSAGCGPTSCAMAISHILGKEVLPPDVAKWMLANGCKALKQGTYYGGIVKAMNHWGIECRQITGASVYHSPSAPQHAQALKALQEGNLVIACMGPGTWTKGGHYVLAWHYDNVNVNINDPASKAASRMKNTAAKWQNEVKQYFVVTVPRAEQPVPDPEPTVEVDDEMVESRKVIVLGNEYEMDVINKDGYNYIKAADFRKAGFQIMSNGKTPSIGFGQVTLDVDGEDRTIPGVNSGGSTIAGVRAVAEALGRTVGWADGKVTVR